MDSDVANAATDNTGSFALLAWCAIFPPLTVMVAVCFRRNGAIAEGFVASLSILKGMVAVVQARNEIAEADPGKYVFYQAAGFLGSMTFSSSNTAKSSGLQVTISSTP